jgi:hypothetical protein
MDIQDEEVRILMMDILKELRGSKLRGMVSRISWKHCQIGHSSADVNDSCVFGCNWHKSSHEVVVALDIHFKATEPFPQFRLSNRLDGGQMSCIRDKDIDLTNSRLD